MSASTTSFSLLLASKTGLCIPSDGGRAPRRRVSPSHRDLLQEQLLMLNTTAAACWAGNKKGQIHVYSSQRYKRESKKKQQQKKTRCAPTNTHTHTECAGVECLRAANTHTKTIWPVVHSVGLMTSKYPHTHTHTRKHAHTQTHTRKHSHTQAFQHDKAVFVLRCSGAETHF